jgi:hypothetical protein
MELAIYRYLDNFGPAVSTTIPALLAVVGENTPFDRIVERLKDLKSQNRIGLFKYGGDTRIPFDKFAAVEGEHNFWGGGFVIEIAPQGRKYFEELETRDQQEKQSGLIFISCGQYDPKEIKLGKDLVLAVDEHLSSCKGYFAQNQNSLESLSHHIFEALDKCSGFVAVMHHRGEVQTKHSTHLRASLWIEQEVAIAAFLTQVYKKQFPIAFYLQRGIKREGVREQLRIDAIEFDNEAAVLADFTQQLKGGKFKPLVRA